MNEPQHRINDNVMVQWRWKRKHQPWYTWQTVEIRRDSQVFEMFMNHAEIITIKIRGEKVQYRPLVGYLVDRTS